MKGYNTRVTRACNKGEIGEAERAQESKRIDDSRVVLNQYIKYYETKKKREYKVLGSEKEVVI